VTIDYEKKTTVICSLKELLKKLPKKSPKKPPKASSAINSITKFFNLIRNVKALIVETIATLVIDIFIAHISVNASLRMADKDKLVIKNYHTSIMIIKPENDLKNAYAYYKVSLYCAHLTLVIYCLFTAKWCFLTISKVDPTMLYDIIPWSLLLPLCTFFTIFIGARTLLNNAIILDCIIHILQILYILHQLLCLPFSSIKCNKLALSQTAQEGIEILSLQNFGLQILNVIDVISLLITVIVLMLLIYWWIVAFHRLDKSSRDSVESLKELKWHLEYVPAAEFEYEDCEDMYGNYLEKDLEEHAKKSPFLMYIPNLKT
ncbi:30417_t:CDS:2, partial [Racocetra persica]